MSLAQQEIPADTSPLQLLNTFATAGMFDLLPKQAREHSDLVHKATSSLLNGDIIPVKIGGKIEYRYNVCA